MQALLDKDQDTVCALSTAQGKGGIAVIRVSGANALAFVRKLAPALASEIHTHRVYLSKIVDPHSRLVTDEVLITFFEKGKSFTGEEIIEISCHGSNFITQKIVNDLIEVGCRHADKGEFTYRAFMNNKIDLIQAESVLNVIESQSHRSSTQALRQLQGELSLEIHKLEEDLLLTGAHLEAQIDFVEQDLEPQEETALLVRLRSSRETVGRLLASYSKGRLLKEGLQAVFLGNPNVGKSSLLNTALGEERAIVTNIAGTTRDVVSGAKLISGVDVCFSDTAGLRSSENPIEQMGIARSFDAVSKADVIFIVVDATQPELPKIESSLLINKKVFLIFNKLDLIDDRNNTEKDSLKVASQAQKVFCLEEQPLPLLMSASEKSGFDLLEKAIVEYINNDFNENSMAIVSSRQFESLSDIAKNIDEAILLLKKKESPEFSAFEIKSAVISVHRLLGKEYDDQIMDKVFSEFCLGK